MLTIREAMVFEARIRGLTIKEVARELHLSYHTVHHHLEVIYKKLQVHSLQEAIFTQKSDHCIRCRKGSIAPFRSLRRAG